MKELLLSAVTAVLLLSPGDLVTAKPNKAHDRNLACLATNVYREARGEPILGQYAVAQVTINRSGTISDLCKTVYEPYQFSWTLKNKNLKYDDKSLRIAIEVVKGSRISALKDATHFHAVYVKPEWSSKFKRLKRIGNHIFYEEI